MPCSGLELRSQNQKVTESGEKFLKKLSTFCFLPCQELPVPVAGVQPGRCSELEPRFHRAEAERTGPCFE